MAQEIRPPEWVLEELYKTARSWMAARARERAHGAPSEWGRGDGRLAREEPALEDRLMQEEHRLRSRFQELVDEFVHQVEEL